MVTEKTSFDLTAEKSFWEEESVLPPSPVELSNLREDLALWAPGVLDLATGARVLDLGAGKGPLGALFSTSSRAKKIVSFDLGHHRLKAAKPYTLESGAYALVCGDVFRMPFTNHAFDVVCANSVLHHLPRLNEAVIEISRVLALGGRYYGREPNFDNPVVRTAVFKCDGTWIRKGSRVSSNEYPLRASQIRRAFANAGCSCTLNFFWRRLAALHHPKWSVAISVIATRL